MKIMKKLTTQQVKHIADLAKLSLNSQEIALFKKQLGEILSYIDKLKEVETENIEPTSQVTGLENVTREDTVEENLSKDQVLSGGKSIYQGMFKVKRVFEEQ